MGEDNRHKMMQNLFGDQSEEEEEVEEIYSEHEATRRSDYLSDEGEGGGELEGEVEVEVEGQGESEVESDVEMHDLDPDPGESEGERAQNSSESDVSDQRVESEGIEAESDEQDEDYGQRVVTSRRKEFVNSASGGNQSVDNEDEEVDQISRSSRSPSEEKEETHIAQSAAEIRDVFGDSDEEEPAEYVTQNILEPESPVSGRSPLEVEGTNEKNLRPEDIVPDEDANYESEEDNIEQKSKEKPAGPPLELEIPLRPPPGQPDKVNMIKVSNIMGIEPQPFDSKAYVEEDMFVTYESGSKKRIRLENNIVRWRSIQNPDGTSSYESNARFVRWSDGSLQLLLGNEVLDISVQDAQHDQAHLFLRHGKGILQSQGRLLKKMRFMPSSLLSNSHRLLTALVDSRHKKVYKVKNCVTHIDPEREKEEKEKAEGQTIRANELLHRKREKVDKKYAQTVERVHQLSPGFLEEALDEDEDDHEPRRSAAQDRFVEDLEVEAQAEKRILNAKWLQVHKNTPRKPAFSSVQSSRRRVDFSDSEREESAYESDRDEGERSPLQKKEEEPEHEEEEEEDEQDEEDTSASEESEEPRRSKGSWGGFKLKEVESDAESPPRKTTSHRRKAVVFDSDEE